MFEPPVSAFAGPIAELVGHRLLSPPTRPGLLAVLSHYEVVRVLGGGGMGVVLLARDSETGNNIAIKMVSLNSSPTSKLFIGSCARQDICEAETQEHRSRAGIVGSRVRAVFL